MNLEDLISKYIDGELNNVEDKLLRETLASNELASQKLDASLYIHSLFFEDAETIQTPNFLYDNTEDLVLMRILAETENAKPKVLIPNYYSLAAAIALFFLISIFEIGDIAGLNSVFSENSSPDKSLKSDKVIVPENNNLASINEKPEIEYKHNNEKNSFSSNNALLAIKTETESKETWIENNDLNLAKNTEDLESDGSIPNIFESNDVIESLSKERVTDSVLLDSDADIKRTNTVSSLNSNVFNAYNSDPTIQNSRLPLTNPLSDFSPLGISNNFYDFGAISQNSIDVMTLLSSEVLRAGFDGAKNISVSSFSQSIAYRIADKHYLGAEIGYTEYSYNEEVKVNVKLSQDYRSSIEAFNPSNDDILIEHPFNYKRTKHLFWASAFYERSLLETDIFSLSGRIGAGASNDGFVGFGRAMAKYNVIGGLYLTVGAEGRVFSYETPSTFLTAGRSTKSTIAIIYGLQMRF